MEIPMIDWLAVTVDIVSYELRAKKLIDELENLKELASENRCKHKSDKVCIDIGKETFEVLSNGAIGYAYILRNNQMELKMAKFRSRNENNYPVFVHFSSAFLWAVGPENIWYWFKDWVEKYIGPVKRDKLNRVDICCHTDSIQFKREDEERFKGRYRKERASRSNREFTGFEFGSRGSGTIFVRIYNKSKEVADKKEKIWFYIIWEDNCLKPMEVWNIEFELHREIFKQMKIETCDQLFSNIKSIWRYLTAEWLVMINQDSNRSERCSMVREWESLQKAFDKYEGKKYITREKQKSCEKEALISSAMGYLTSYSALSGIKEPKDSALNLLTEGLRSLNTRGKDFRQIAKIKRKLLGFG